MKDIIREDFKMLRFEADELIAIANKMKELENERT